MKFKIVCFVCFSCTIFFSTGQNHPKRTATQQPAPTLQMQLMNEQVSALMADRVGVNKGVAGEELATIDVFFREELDDLLEYESMMFPADELYGYWDTTWVNPYRSKEIIYPDSFYVDCSSFVLPIDNTIKVTSVFGPRRMRMHNGIDLKVQKGDTIRSAFNGKVRIRGFERRGYGYYLVIRHSNGLETVYGHLSGFLVSENEIVHAGQPVGLGGNTGRSTGTHLHFETRFLGQALNPSSIIDFDNGGAPRNDQYVLYKGNFGKNTNIYTSTSERIVYHRVQSGETLGKIALQYKTTVAELCRLNGLTAKSTLRIGQSIRCGTTFVKTTQKDTDETALASISEEPVLIAAAFHTVQTKETLSSIARQYNTTVDALCRLNNIQSTIPLKVGQEICYRAASKPVAPKIESQKEEENNADDTILASTSDQPIPEDLEVQTEMINYHLVKQGETLYSIARQYETSVNEICLLNGISESEVLSIGQNIRYKGSQTVSPAKAEAANITESAVKTTKIETVQPVYYRIKEGDTLGAIAQKHGLTINQLCELNNITKTTILRIGRTLRCS